MKLYLTNHPEKFKARRFKNYHEEDGMDKPYFKSVPEKTVTSKDEARAEIADRLNALLISLDKSVPHGIEHTMARVKARESAMWALEGIG